LSKLRKSRITYPSRVGIGEAKAHSLSRLLANPQIERLPVRGARGGWKEVSGHVLDRHRIGGDDALWLPHQHRPRAVHHGLVVEGRADTFVRRLVAKLV